jgi:hypothetical protein
MWASIMTTSTDRKKPGAWVIGPEGFPLSLNDMPPPGIKRWMARQKAEIVIAVESGLLSIVDACKRYDLSPDEFLAWKTAFGRHGMEGLRVTRSTMTQMQGR